MSVRLSKSQVQSGDFHDAEKMSVFDVVVVLNEPYEAPRLQRRLVLLYPGFVGQML